MNNLIRIIRNNNNDYRNKIKALLSLEGISQKTKVEFALYCAKQSFKYIDEIKYPDLHKKTSKVLELIGDWILGKNVSVKELNAARKAATDAAFTANASPAASFATNAASYAAYYSASYAATDAATDAAFTASYNKNIKELYNYALLLIIKELNIDNTIKVLYGAS